MRERVREEREPSLGVEKKCKNQMNTGQSRRRNTGTSYSRVSGTSLLPLPTLHFSPPVKGLSQILGGVGGGGRIFFWGGVLSRVTGGDIGMEEG